MKRRGDRDRLPPHQRGAPRRRGRTAPSRARPGQVGHRPAAPAAPGGTVGDPAEGLVDLVDAAVVDAVNVAVGLLLHPLVARAALPAALVPAVLQHAGQAPAAAAENLRAYSFTVYLSYFVFGTHYQIILVGCNAISDQMALNVLM